MYYFTFFRSIEHCLRYSLPEYVTILTKLYIKFMKILLTNDIWINWLEWKLALTFITWSCKNRLRGAEVQLFSWGLVTMAIVSHCMKNGKIMCLIFNSQFLTWKLFKLLILLLLGPSLFSRNLFKLIIYVLKHNPKLLEKFISGKILL